MIYDDETLGRYIDGELDARAAAALEAAIARDAALAARVDRMRAVSMDLRGEFDVVLSETLPERLRDAVMTTPSDFAMPRPVRQGRVASWRLPAFVSGAAGAAGLALGLAIAPVSILALDESGHLVANGTLAAILQDGLASSPNGDALIGVSFRAGDGRWCRSFETGAEAAGLAGLACATDGVWLVEIAAVAPSRAGGYAQASAALPQTVRDQIERMIVGEPLDAAGERAMRDAGWK